VGANKGYSLASFADMFAPELGITPSAIHPRILRAFGDKIVNPCGACNDCQVDHVASLSSRTCTLEGGQVVPATHFSVDIHGFEPVAANIDIVKAGVMAVFEEANAPNVQIHLHRVAVVGDPAVESVPFGMCPPGMERCGVEAAGTAGGITTWNYDKVPIELVAASTVDAMRERFGVREIDVLAIDTEGLDPEVIDGAASMLAAHRIKLLQFEYHGMRAWKTRSLESMVATLSGHGYDCFLAQHASLLRLTNCWDPSYEFKYWSNVICVLRANSALLAVAEGFAPSSR
jgi:FkbM family methyltransferase